MKLENLLPRKLAENKVIVPLRNKESVLSAELGPMLLVTQKTVFEPSKFLLVRYGLGEQMLLNRNDEEAKAEEGRLHPPGRDWSSGKKRRQPLCRMSLLT